MVRIFLLLFVALFINSSLEAQVGINTEDPKTTLHVFPSSTNATTAEGIIAPNLLRSEVIIKDNKYNTTEKGAMIYVTDLSGVLTTKTNKITKIGYYYFDGDLWQPFTESVDVPSQPWLVQGGTTQSTSNTQAIYQTGSVGIGASTAVPSAYKFQVTGASNITGNSQVGSSTVLGNEYITGLSKIGGSTTYNNSVQLELGDNNKALLLNRVALTNISTKAPVTNALEGMVLYNTTNIPTQGLVPGFHYWNGASWTRLVDKLPEQGKVNTYYSTVNVKGGVASGSSQWAMVSIPFSTSRETTTATAITLPETGSYAFNIKLYSSLGVDKPEDVLISVPTKTVVYVGIWVNGTLEDVSEIFTIAEKLGGTGNINTNYVTNVILGCSGNVGDTIDVRLGYLTSSVPDKMAVFSRGKTSTTPISDATSMIFWKL